MHLQYVFLIFVLGSIWCGAHARVDVENLIGTAIQPCINCLCHARSGCWSRFNCARYSINKQYWRDAGGPTVPTTSNDEDVHFRECMNDENCILNTIKRYTERFNGRDCNNDGTFDCKDRLAIHLFGENCNNLAYGQMYARRFNDCANQVGVIAMEPQEGTVY